MKRRVVKSPTTKSPIMPPIPTKLLIPTASMKHSIHVMTHCISDESQVVCEMLGMKLEKGDLVSLMPHRFVNSQVVDTVVNLLNSIADTALHNVRRVYFDSGTTGFVVGSDVAGRRCQDLPKLCKRIMSIYGRTKIACAEMRQVVGFLLTECNNKKAGIVKAIPAKRGEVPRSDDGYDCGLWAIPYMHVWEGCMLLPLDPECAAEYQQCYVANLLQSSQNRRRDQFLANPERTSSLPLGENCQ